MDTNRFPVSINERIVKCSEVSDGFENSIVIHEYPNRNGGKPENLGLNTRIVRLQTHWFAESYEEHKSFLKDMLKPDLVELIHPAYGPMQGMIRLANVHHDDGINYCSIDIEFVENNESLSSIEVISPGIGAKSEAFSMETVEQQQTELDKSLIGALHGVLAAIENGIRSFEGVMANVTIPADSIITAIAFGTDLPGRIIGAISKCVARYAQATKATANSPVAFISALSFGLKKLSLSINSFALSGAETQSSKTARLLLMRHFGLAASAQICLQAAYAFESEEEGRNMLRQRENQTAFDVRGNYLRPDAIPQIMNIRELEHCLAIVRRFCAERIGIFGITDETASREIPAIKQMCAALLYYIRTIKIEMENIVEIDVDPPLPLHLVCLIHGLPYQMAERILSINDIENPNCVSGKINIYAQ